MIREPRSGSDILVDFNGYIRAQEDDGGYFDYKTRFKSQAAIKEIMEDVLRGHQRAARRNSDVEFHLAPIEQSASE